jgi:LemA protein
MSWTFLVVPLALLTWVAIAYNLLVRDRNRVAQGWSDVDVQLKRRHDLIPRLADVVKGYAGYERALLSSLAELRTRVGDMHPAARGAAETDVGRGVMDGIRGFKMYLEVAEREDLGRIQGPPLTPQLF